QSGSIVFPSTEQVHTGLQSVKLVSTASSQDKGIHLYHEFAAPVYGRFTVWMSDTGANAPSSNYIAMSLLGATGSRSMGTFDYNSAEGRDYQAGDGIRAYDTGIPRTQAWHKLEITTAA